jgi:hypothetical protein
MAGRLVPAGVLRNSIRPKRLARYAIPLTTYGVAMKDNEALGTGLGRNQAERSTGAWGSVNNRLWSAGTSRAGPLAADPQESKKAANLTEARAK